MQPLVAAAQQSSSDVHPVLSTLMQHFPASQSVTAALSQQLGSVTQEYPTLLQLPTPKAPLALGPLAKAPAAKKVEITGAARMALVTPPLSSSRRERPGGVLTLT